MGTFELVEKKTNERNFEINRQYWENRLYKYGWDCGTLTVKRHFSGNFVPSTASCETDAAPSQLQILLQSVNVTSLPFFSLNVP